MMPDIDAVLLAVSGSLAASVVVKATAVVALGLAGAGIARGSRAAVRHALLAVAFVALAALPMVMLAARPVRIALRMAAAQEAAIPVAAAPAAAASVAPVETPVSNAAAAQPAPVGISPAAWLAAAWMAGAAVFLLPMIVGLWQVRRLRRTGLPWRHGQEMADGLAAETGVRRRVEVLLHEELAGPMMCGALRPAIVLPVDARNWEDEDLKRALVHEMEHARRGDWLSYCFARAVCAAYWFHPAVWMARRRLTLEAERACDDAVLARSEATAYADQLVGVAERLMAAARPPVLAMASRADLAKRVGAVLDGRQRRGRAGAAVVALACAGAAAVVMTVGPLQVVAAPEAVVTDVTASAPVVEPASGPVTAAPQVPVARTHIAKPAPVLVAAAPQAAASPQTATPPPALQAPQGAAASQVPEGPRGALATMARFKSGAMLVQVDVTATYPNGGSIAGLTASDFAVSEDGVRQSIKVFEFQQPDGAPDYYILGYYTANSNLDGKFRKIEVALPGNPTAKLGYRAGYNTLAQQPSVAPPTPGPGVTFPQLQHEVEPAYSEAARERKFQGTVVLQITVNADGTVGDMHVLRSLGWGLDEKAIEAVKQWKFIPGTQNLAAVPMQALVQVNFLLL